MTAPAPPVSRTAPSSSTPTAHPSKREVAAAAVVAKPSPSAQQPATDVPLLTPSIEAIMASFRTSGQDTEMLKLILLAKAKEDERLAALDHLRTEQLRAANTIALHQYWYQYQAFMAQAQAQAQGQLPPYSPTSPPPPGKRPRAPSDASNSSTGDEQTGKRQKTIPGQGGKPSHEAVMEALRRKCQANQSQSHASAPPASSSSSSSSRNSPPASLATSHRPLAPAPAPAPAPPSHRSSPSLSPPLPPHHSIAPPIPRRLSPPSFPSRHTSFLRPANAPPAPTSSSSPAPPAPSSTHVPPPPLSLSLSPVQEEEPAASSHPPPSTRDKLAMLLHATDAAAAASLRNEAARTSDVRGAAVPVAVAR
ncbi:hypothetical protein JCM1840_002774 [Sporobolomyces johnsonii]